MTPEHQQIIDVTLSLASARAANLAQQTDRPRIAKEPSEPSSERLRASFLGKQLERIALYVEGYHYEGSSDVRADVNAVVLTLFRDMIHQNTFRQPPKFHRTPLGQLLSQAMLRFFRSERPGRLMKVAEAVTLCQVRRQTVHEWAEDGTLWPIYDEQGQVYFDRQSVEQVQKRRNQASRA